MDVLKGTYERATTNVLNTLDFESDWLFVDLGANFGIFTRYFADNASASSKVLAVEAHPKTASLLRRNVKHYSNVVVENKAVSSEDGHIEMCDLGNPFAHSRFDLTGDRGPEDPVHFQQHFTVKAELSKQWFGVLMGTKTSYQGELRVLSLIFGAYQKSFRWQRRRLVLEFNPFCLRTIGVKPVIF